VFPTKPVESPLLRRVLASPARDAIAERILDAALEKFGRFGLSRSSVEDVAAQAGVARITVYRRFQGKDALIEAVLLRECHRCLAALDEAVGELPEIEARIVEAFRFALDYARGHPLVGGLLEVEPGTILPFMTVQVGPVLAAVREYVAATLRQAGEAGQLDRTGDAETVAELMIRIAVSFVISPESCVRLGTDSEARAFARRYLVPLDRPRTAGTERP
jgi:AcrR family transcriptional regulator